jgi:hypothetical protein
MRRILAVALALILIPLMAFAAGVIELPQTGQTKCYDTAGTEIACAGTGQDGEIRAGAIWPSPRFTNPNGTTPIDGNIILDRLTGLEWPKDGGSPTVGTCTGGMRTWEQAIDYVACLNANNYLGHNDWRLPNINELESLVNEPYTATWLNGLGFNNVQANYYWSSTTSAASTGYAWGVSMWTGDVYYCNKTYSFYVWPVRAGQVGNSVISLPKTGQTTLYRAGDDGDLERGVAWPNPRFTVQDDCVTDTLTGLMWPKNANLLNGTRTWNDAIDYANNLTLCGHSDWRLPNRKELMSLVDRSRYNPALPPGHLFDNVQANYYWSSTTVATGPYPWGIAWNVDMWDGYVGDNYKAYSNYYVWPVRAGQGGSSDALTGSNYNLANISARSDDFHLWADLSVNGQAREDVCSNFSLSVKVGEETKAIQQTCDSVGNGTAPNTRKYRIGFRINADPQHPRAAWFEGGTVHACQNSSPTNCTALLSDFSVYGTTFDITRHAWSFANGSWTQPHERDFWILESDLHKAGKVIAEYLDPEEREKFWSAFNDPRLADLKQNPSKLADFILDTPGGGCYGLTNSAIANFTRSGEAAWGTDGSSGKNLDEPLWRTDIGNHWSLDHPVTPFKPFVHDNIYSSDETQSSSGQDWTLQSAKKIMYYHVGQPFYSGANWVGKDRLYTVDQNSMSNLREILRGGSPVSLGIQTTQGRHAVAVTQLLRWNNHDKYIIWDNRLPYASKQNGYGPYLEWYVPNTSLYQVTGNTFSVVSESDGNGWHLSPEHSLDGLPGFLSASGDSQRIYNISGAVAARASLSTRSPQSDNAQGIAYPYPGHIKVLLLGGSVDAVYEYASGVPVALVPDGEIVPGQAVSQSSTGGIYNFLYLPADKTYRIEATKYPQFAYLEVYVTVPNADGTVERINYENIQTGAQDQTNIYFFVGRNNTDKGIRRSVTSLTASRTKSSTDIYNPDYEGTIPTVMPPPGNFRGVVENNAVRLNWDNPSHPAFARVDIVRKEGSQPVSPTDGSLVYQGNATQATDSSVTPGNSYYYAAYSVDTASNFSSPAYVGIDMTLHSVYGTITKATGGGLGGASMTLRDADGRVAGATFTGADGSYTFSNLADGYYTIDATHGSYLIGGAPAQVTVNGANVEQNLSATPTQTLSLNLGLTTAYIGNELFISWTYRNIDNSKMVNITLNRTGTPESLGANIPITQGNIRWTVTGPPVHGAFLRISLGDDAGVYSEKTLNIAYYQYTANLNPGWNFLSLPIQPMDTAINTVLTGTESALRIVWGYENERKTWRKYVPNATGNTLLTIEAGKGYWFYADTPVSFIVTGTNILPSVSLSEGWNLVGYHGAVWSYVTNAATNMAGKWRMMWGWENGAWSGLHETLTNLPVQTLDRFLQGKAYWIKIKSGQAGEWVQ